MSANTYTLAMQEAGYDDLILPIESFTLRLRQSPSKCYVNVIVPNVIDHIDDIDDRVNGELILSCIIGSTTTNLITANTEEFRYDQGSRNRSGTLTGYKQITFPSDTVTVPNTVYKRVSGGVTTYRAPPLTTLKPNVTALVFSSTLLVSTVEWSVSKTYSVMEFSDG